MWQQMLPDLHKGSIYLDSAGHTLGTDVDHLVPSDASKCTLTEDMIILTTTGIFLADSMAYW